MTLQLIIVGLIVLCVIISVMIYYSTVHVALKLVALPFTIIFAIQTAYFVYDKLGSPIEGMPVGEFEYNHHKTAGTGDFIMLWANQDTRNRLYIFEYNREDMKKMNEAKESQEKSKGNTAIIMTVDQDGDMQMLLTDGISDERPTENRIKTQTREQALQK